MKRAIIQTDRVGSVDENKAQRGEGGTEGDRRRDREKL